MVIAISAPASPRDTHDDELEYLSSATLTKRKDFLEAEEEARTAPNRVLYYRRNADCERLIQACTAKLVAEPGNVRALLIRAASYTKKGERAAPSAPNSSHGSTASGTCGHRTMPPAVACLASRRGLDLCQLLVQHFFGI